MRPRLLALVPAAGGGRRFGGAVPKQLLPVAGRPLILWTVERLLAVGVDALAVALPAAALAAPELEALAGPQVKRLAGGATRQESVARCLAALPGRPEDLLLIHDGARPAVHPEDVAAVVAATRGADGAVLGRSLTDTLKQVAEGEVVSTLEREGCFRAETPQVFRREVLERALAAAAAAGFLGTDESSLVERLAGVRIRAVAARRPNPKLTAPGDLAIIETLLALR